MGWRGLSFFPLFFPDFLIGGHVPNFLREPGTFLGSPRGCGRGFFLEPGGVRTSPGQLPARGLLSILLLPRKSLLLDCKRRINLRVSDPEQGLV